MSLNLTNSTGAAINTINLSKIEIGQRINLSKEQPTLSVINMKIVWDSDFDLDISAVLLDANDRGINRDASTMVFYSNPAASGISHSGDIQTVGAGSIGTEELIVKLNEVDPRVQKILFVATTHSETPPAITFGRVRKAEAFLINAETNQALYTFQLSEDHSMTTAVECAQLYRRDNGWVFTSMETDVGTHHMGLQGIVDKYIA